MIIAEITMVDGDTVYMPFKGIKDLDVWMDLNKGRYTAIRVKGLDGGIEHDDDWIRAEIERR